MVIVNYRIAMDSAEHGPQWLLWLADRFEGRAAATFVVLAGIGTSLLTKSARATNKSEQRKQRLMLMRRSLFLAGVGLPFYLIWPADILHFYAAYLLLASLFIAASNRTLVWCIVGSVTGFLILLSFVDYETGWNFTTLTYKGFWSPEGFLRNLFFNGFHPVFPWFAFFAGGMLIGRLELKDWAVQRKLLHAGLLLTAVAEISSFLLVQVVKHINNLSVTEKEDLGAIFGTHVIPPSPLYVIACFGVAMTVISGSLYLAERFKSTAVIRSLQYTGQLALTLYLAHVIVGLGVLEVMTKLSPHSTQFAIFWSLLFSAVAVAFANLWRRKFSRGPLEALMRKLSG